MQAIHIIPNCAILYKSYFDSTVTSELWSNVAQTCSLSYTKIKIYGRECIQNRMTAYYGDVDFKYSGTVMPQQEMPLFLKDIITHLNAFFKVKLNSCLINYYPDGTSNIGHHSDNTDNMVVTISLGGSRTFQFKSKSDNTTHDTLLHDGDMVVMYGNCQKLFTHSVIKDDSVTPRISLTFREII